MISVIIPVLNESEFIVSVIRIAKKSPLVTEIIVVDDGSVDGTPEIAKKEKAQVVLSTMLGKGASMEDGAKIANNEILVFLDGDMNLLDEKVIDKITSPIIDNVSDFVKAKFTREMGRVTILTARPLLSIFFPELNYIEQPLGGIIAIRRSLIQKIRLESDYGVDVGLLLDASFFGARINQVDIGSISHKSHSLYALQDIAKQVTRVIFNRAHKYNRFTYDQVQEIDEIERQTFSEFDYLVQNINNTKKLALFDMDDTLVNGRYILSLAEAVNKTKELSNYLDNFDISIEDRTRFIGKIFAGVPKKTFEKIAASIKLNEGAQDAIIHLRKNGYTVGIVSDSFFIATEIIRRRVFADFSIAHYMKFNQDVASGNITPTSTMIRNDGCKIHKYCKLNVMLNLKEKMEIDSSNILSVGDSENDICLLRESAMSIAFKPKFDTSRFKINHIIHGSLSEIIDLF